MGFSLLDFLKSIFSGTYERPSSSDIVPTDKITYQDGIIKADIREIIGLSKSPVMFPLLPIPDSNSMDPDFDTGNKNIYIAGADQADQQCLIDWLYQEYLKGNKNSVVYQVPGYNPIIHRVYSVFVDKGVRVWRMKGDNNPRPDLLAASDEDIKYLHIGTIF